MHYATKNRCEYTGFTPAKKIKRCRRRAGPNSKYCAQHRRAAEREDAMFQAEMTAAEQYRLRRRWQWVTMGVSGALLVSIFLGILF